MQEFDPRRPTVRYAPRVLACTAVAAVLAFGGPMLLQDGQGAARAKASDWRNAPGPAIGDGPRLRDMQDKSRPRAIVAEGRLSDSLYASALEAGAPPQLTDQVVKLFAHKLDLSRDIHDGDRLRLVFNRGAQADDLLFAEIIARDQITRVYRYQPAGTSQPGFFDALGHDIRGLLLHTPVDGARVSSGFGMRVHPILGYSRVHQGIDFAAPAGAPVYAAGDGVVEEVRWAGGYGRWLKIRHDAEWETGYGHLSRWAVQPGEHVRQGQVVAYVGSTGEATGPHLHYEVMLGGRKINPKGAGTPEGAALAGPDLAAFKAQQANIEAMLASASAVQLAEAGEARLSPAAFHGRLDPGAGLRLALP